MLHVSRIPDISAHVNNYLQNREFDVGYCALFVPQVPDKQGTNEVVTAAPVRSLDITLRAYILAMVRVYGNTTMLASAGGLLVLATRWPNRSYYPLNSPSTLQD